MLIANPLFDSAFKFLMQDLTVARHFISIILNRNIEIEGFEATEDALINTNRETGFSSQRMDFHATIIEENGTKRKVLIELQKSHTLTDISRFRRYLAKSYYDTDTLPKNAEHEEIISIYILGFKLNIPVAVVKTSTQLIDASTQELLNANTDDDVFIRKLHHESIFIDTTKLTNKMQNRVDRLLAVFNQTYITENKFTLDIPVDDLTIPNTDLVLINRLNYALLDKELRHNLSVQAEYQMVIDKEISTVEQKAKLEIAKSMKNEGLDNNLILKLTSLTQEEIDKL
ncbi:MAG: hypothetical protein RLZZ210_617 [Pseudomonadota bacterium]|jgi:hypothetical protein